MSGPAPDAFAAAVALLAAYLLGSLSFAVIVSRAMGLADPRGYGSGNPGATNVLRSGSKAAAVATLVLDAAKGWLAVMAVRWWGAPWGLGEGTAAAAGLAAFVGHLYPVFFRFQGGKGVATAAGVVLALAPWLGVATLATFAIVAFFFRYVSLASMVAAVFAPAYYAIGAGVAWPFSWAAFWALVAMAALLLWRHRANIGRLAAGTESRLGKKS